MNTTNESSICEGCPGRCCSLKTWGFDHVQLTMQESERPLFADHIVWVKLNGSKNTSPVLPLKDGCRFLGSDNRCTIYKERPQACRLYMCTDEEPDRLRNLFKQFPEHKKYLNSIGANPIKVKRNRILDENNP